MLNLLQVPNSDGSSLSRMLTTFRVKNASGRSLPFCCECAEERKDALLDRRDWEAHSSRQPHPQGEGFGKKGILAPDGMIIEREEPCLDDKAIPSWEEPEIVKAEEMATLGARFDEDVTVEKGEYDFEDGDVSDIDEDPVCDEDAKCKPGKFVEPFTVEQLHNGDYRDSPMGYARPLGLCRGCQLYTTERRMSRAWSSPPHDASTRRIAVFRRLEPNTLLGEVISVIHSQQFVTAEVMLTAQVATSIQHNSRLRVFINVWCSKNARREHCGVRYCRIEYPGGRLNLPQVIEAWQIGKQPDNQSQSTSFGRGGSSAGDDERGSDGSAKTDPTRDGQTTRPQDGDDANDQNWATVASRRDERQSRTSTLVCPNYEVYRQAKLFCGGQSGMQLMPDGTIRVRRHVPGLDPRCRIMPPMKQGFTMWECDPTKGITKGLRIADLAFPTMPDRDVQKMINDYANKDAILMKDLNYSKIARCILSIEVDGWEEGTSAS